VSSDIEETAITR